MKPFSLIKGYGLLAVLDAAAVTLWLELWRLPGFSPAAGGWLTHLAVAGVSVLLPALLPGGGERPGRWLLGGLGGLLALSVPVVGPLAAGLIAAMIAAPIRQPKPERRVVRGNPAREGLEDPAPPHPTAIREPFFQMLQGGAAVGQWLVVPVLRQSRSPAAVRLLRLLTSRGDARTQLYAQGALSTLLDASEREIQSLQTRRNAGAAAGQERERLATVLLQAARGGVFPSDHGRALSERATELLEELAAERPDDAVLLHELARCHLSLGRFDKVPELLQRLQALPGGARLAPLLEAAYCNATGQWHRLAEALRVAAAHGAPLRAQSREFWLSRRPLRHPTRSHA